MYKQKAKMKQKKILKVSRGITLIALVITIIVLLILAGVSIAMLTGENGILKRAIDAKEQTEKATEEEQRQFTIAEATMNFENTEYTDKNGDKALIPAGFAVSQVEGENTIKNGLVIIDTKGNEFVWIPVENPDDYKDNVLYNFELHSEYLQQDNGYLPNGLSIPEGKTEQEIEKNIITNEKTKGFYISRYEAGDELASEARTQESAEGKLVSKKNVYPYNWITQTASKEKAKEFINNNNVKSGLITSIQYDLVMTFINEKKDGTGEDYNVLVASDTRHRSSGIEVTGNNEADKVCNIYDLEGNCYEFVAAKNNHGIFGGWTAESPYVARGGRFNRKMMAAYRTGSNGDAHENNSFHFVLYVIMN